jgi:hypothetical protein
MLGPWEGDSIKMRTQLAAGVAAVAVGALCFTPAQAQSAGNPVMLSATIDGGWQNEQLHAGGGGGGANGSVWNVDGSIAVPFEDDWAAQVNGGYTRLTVTGVDIDSAYVAGSVAWIQHWGRLGGTVSYTQQDIGIGAVPNVRLASTGYGAFVDWYATPQITVAGRAGGLSGTFSLVGLSRNFSNAYYVGGEIKGYVIPDLAVTGNVDYSSVSLSPASFHTTNAGVGAEWLVSRDYPLALTFKYDYSTTSTGGGGGSFNSNAVGVGAKFYFGGPMKGSLVDHQRSGSDDEATSPVYLNRIF